MTSGFRQDSPADQAAAPREYEYLTPEKLAVAESPGQRIAIYLLVHSLEELARRRGWSESQVGSHMFFAWKQDAPLLRIAPDVFLLDQPPSEDLASCQTWTPGQPPPRWAAEIVSQDWGKDYNRAPEHYAELGCRELVLFDPAAASGQAHNEARTALTIYRRFADGAFRRTYAGPGPAFSDELGCWLLPRAERYRMVLRLSEDPEGRRILPTDAERADAEKQRALAAKEQAEAAKERAQTAKERAQSARERAQTAKERAQTAKEQAETEKQRAAAAQRQAKAEKRRADAEERRAVAEERRADAEAAARATAEQRIRELEAALKRGK